MATKTPSEWLRLLCRDWSLENESIIAATDTRFLHYKSYLKGQLTSQLLCRLSISGNELSPKEHVATLEMAHDPTAMPAPSIDFWKILGVEDEFDRAHIVANIERFCSLYNIRGGTLDELPFSPVADSPTMIGNHYYQDASVHHPIDPSSAAAAAAAAGMSTMSPTMSPPATFLYHMDPIDANATALAAKPHQHHQHQQQHDAPPSKLIRQTAKNQERRLKAELREREREAYSVRKAAEKAARLATREERRRRKLAMRRQREEFAQRQKEAALRRAAELVRSNRVPIEITRGAAAAQAAANAAVANAVMPAAEAAEAMVVVPPAAANDGNAVLVVPSVPIKKGRSSIVISTASDLDQIVTHSNNLWVKYNAIAKEHNQKVNWIVVAKELGIHVKVREKYARMHARAKARGFDFVNWGHYRIKDYPQFFLDPLGPALTTAAPGEPPAKLVEEPGGGKQASYAEGGTPQEQHPLQPMQPVHETVAVVMQPRSLNDVHEIPNRDMMSLAAEAAGVVGDGTSYSDDPAVLAAAAALHHHHHQPSEISEDADLHVVPPLPQGNDNMPMEEMKAGEVPELGGTAPV